MKNTWKRTAAFVLAMALVVGAVPTNVGTGGLFDKAAITASADDVTKALEVTCPASVPYTDTPEFEKVFVVTGEGEDQQKEEIFEGMYKVSTPEYYTDEGTLRGQVTVTLLDYEADPDEEGNFPETTVTEQVSFDVETKYVTESEISATFTDANNGEFDFEYDGTLKVPTVAELYVNGILVNPKWYTIGDAVNNRNANGGAALGIEFNGDSLVQSSYNLQIPFTIKQSTIDKFPIRPVSYIYDGKMKRPTFESGIEGSNATFAIYQGYYKDNGDGTCTRVTSAQKDDPDVYYCQTSASAKGQYYALVQCSTSNNCTGQKIMKWSIVDISGGKTYDGEAVDVDDFNYDVLVEDIDAYGGKDAAVHIDYFDANGNELKEAPTDAGSYKATLTITDVNPAHTVKLPTVTKELFDFEIAKKPITVKPAVTSKAYLEDVPALGYEAYAKVTEDGNEGTEGGNEGTEGGEIDKHSGLVERDKTPLANVQLFKLEPKADTEEVMIEKDTPTGRRCSIVIDETVKESQFHNYDLTYVPAVFVVNPKPFEATVTFKKEKTEDVYENSFSCTYDGEQHTPVIKVTGSSGNILTENVDYEIAEKTENGNTTTTRSATNAGTYYIVLKGKGNYDGEKVVTWTITQKNIADYISKKSTAGTSDAVTVTGATYDGNEHTPTIRVQGLDVVTTNEGTGETAGDFTVTATAQTNAGADYDFTITGAGNYQGTYTGKWEIKKADAEVAATGAKVYDGVAAKAEDITVNLEGLPQDFIYTTTTGDGDDAVITQNISVKFYDYNGIPLFNEETKEYIGSSIKDGNDESKQYLGDEALEMSKGNKVENAINAGNYIAEVTISDASGNYNDAVQLMYFPIAKRQAEIYPESGQSKEYHAAVPEIKFELEEAVEGSNRGVLAADMEKKPIDINGEEVDWVSFLSFTDEMEADTPMGTYEIDIDAFAAPDLMNYEISCSYPVDFEVTPRSLEDNVVFVLKATKGEFNQNSEKSNAFLYDGSTKQVAIDYAYDKNWTVDANAPDGVMVGGNWYKKLTASDYSTAGVVKMAYSGAYAAQAEGMGNYAGEVISGNGLDWYIEDATATITLDASAAGKTYDGEAVNESAFVVEAKTANYPLNKATVTYSYKKVTGYDSASNPITQVVEGAPTDAGTYLVTATAVRRGYAPATATAQFTIAPKEVTISVTGAVDSITYGDTLPTLGKEVVGVLEGEDLGLTGDYQIVKDGTAVTEAVPNAGVYTIKGNFVATNQNYTITPETKAFTILKKDLEDVDGTIEVVSELKNAIADYGVTEAPAFTVVYKAQTGDKTLVSDVANSETYDYAVNAPTVLADGNYTIEVVGEGNYTGIREIKWTVTETDEAKEAARAAIVKYVTVKAPEFVVMSESNRIIKIKAESSVDKTGNPNLEVLKTGTIYYRGADLNGTELTLDTVGTVIDEGTGIAVKDVTKGTTASSVNVSDKYNGIYVRNYAIVGDGTYQAVVYTDTVKTSIEELDAKVQELKEALEKVTVSASATIVSGTTVKLSASAERGDFTNSETGVVYYRGADLNGNELTLDNVGTEIDNGMTIKRVSKGTTASSVNVGDKYNGIYYRGYITVTDSDGNTHTKYTDVRFAKVVDGELTDAVVD